MSYVNHIFFSCFFRSMLCNCLCNFNSARWWIKQSCQ